MKKNPATRLCQGLRRGKLAKGEDGRAKHFREENLMTMVFGGEFGNLGLLFSLISPGVQRQCKCPFSVLKPAFLPYYLTFGQIVLYLCSHFL
jgi:hypothetical protein